MKTIYQNLENASYLIKRSIIILILSCSIQSHAQLRYGVRAGFNFTNMSVKVADDVDKQVKPSFHVGGIVENRLNERYALEAGLLLSGKGTLMEHTETQSAGSVTTVKTISPLYLEIPINGVIKFDLRKSKLRFFAGPYVAFGISGKYEEDYVTSGSVSTIGLNKISRDLKYGTSHDDDVKQTDFGLNFGTGLDFKNWQIRGQFGLGLRNLDPQGDSTIKNFGSSLYGCYMFGK